MKQGSTLFLRGVIMLIGLIMLVLCIVILPGGWRIDADVFSPLLLGLYIPAVPFFYALYQALRLLDLIDTNEAFSQPAVETLKKIKYCGTAISGLFVLGLPFFAAQAAAEDDAPGISVMLLVIIFASWVVAMAAAVFQRLLQNAVDIKSENDLTV